MRDEEALALVARILARLRARYPKRCFAYRESARSGQIWIDDRTGLPPYNVISIRLRDGTRDRTICTIRITGPGMLALSLPYSGSRVFTEITDLGDALAQIFGVMEERGLPPITESLEWRIV